MDDLVLQLSYALLVAAMLARRFMLRVLVAASALAGLMHALLFADDLVLAAWMSALLLASLGSLAGFLLRSRKVKFTAEEERMRQQLLPGISRARARHLIDQGYWLTGEEGDVLTREGEPVAQLYYLGPGAARAISGGQVIGMCDEGDLVGELTVLSGEPAIATVVLTERTRFWCAPAETLRPYLEMHDDIRRAIERGFAKAVAEKLRASNRALAEAGGLEAA